MTSLTTQHGHRPPHGLVRMTDTQLPKALQLAKEWRPSMPHEVMCFWGEDVADELRRLNAINSELLEALQGLLEITDFHELYGSKTEAARAAIAKATGAQE